MASKLQVPTAASDSVVPLTVQTPGVVEVSTTGRPELALAIKLGGAVPNVWLPGVVKLRVCAARATVNDLCTVVAAA